MPQNQRLLINLGIMQGLGLSLILLSPTGVIYSNQTGGVACHHPEVEGALVPLLDPYRQLFDQVNTHFEGEPWFSQCYITPVHPVTFTETDADFLDSVLEEVYYMGRIRVDRERLRECEEAWVYVVVAEDDDSDPFPILRGHNGLSAILTWENSD